MSKSTIHGELKVNVHINSRAMSRAEADESLMRMTHHEVDAAAEYDSRTDDAVHVLQRRVRQRIIDDKQLSAITANNPLPFTCSFIDCVE